MKRSVIWRVPLLAVLLGAWAIAGPGSAANEKHSSGNTTEKKAATSTGHGAAANRDEVRTGNRDEQRFGALLREVLSMVRNENPDRYAELMKLRERDPEAFKNQMQEIILQRLVARRQERLEHAQPGDAARTEAGKTARPPALPAPASAATTAPSEAGGERRGLRLERFLETLQADNPEGLRRLRELRAKDPAKFRDEARQTFEAKYGEYRAKMFGPEDESAEAAKRLRQAATPEQRKQAVEQMRQSVYSSFDKQLASQQQAVDHLEKQLTQARQKLAERQVQREDICRKRFEYLYLSATPAGTDAAGSPAATGPAVAAPRQ